jgi:hypothetical protein
MEGEKMKGKRKKLVAIALLLIIGAASSIVAWWVYFSSTNGEHPLICPQVVIWSETSNDNYRMTVHYIDIQAEDYREWLEIEDMVFLLANSSDYSHMTLRSILYNKSHKHNLGSGSLIDILNNTSGNVTYYDNDYDAHISLNDTFIIRGDLIDKALNESWGVRLYIIYNGDLNGRLSEEQFTPLGYGQIRKKMGGEEK